LHHCSGVLDKLNSMAPSNRKDQVVADEGNESASSDESSSDEEEEKLEHFIVVAGQRIEFFEGRREPVLCVDSKHSSFSLFLRWLVQLHKQL